MFLCDTCHDKSGCTYVHLSGSTGPCEGCRTRASCHECQGERVELAPITVEEIRTNLLCHLNELARMAGSCGRSMAATLLTQIECAKHMCRLAGVAELEISKVDRFLGAAPAPVDPNVLPILGNR